MLPRFQKIDQTVQEENFNYGQVFFLEKTSGGERLVIGCKDGHIKLMQEMCRYWSDGWYLLYVLLVSRTGRAEGRYESRLYKNFDDLQNFHLAHQNFLQSDGRHHYWIGSDANEGLLVYDQHNLIFAYGNLRRYTDLLLAQGFTEKEFWFPTPHQHHYHAINDQLEDAFFAADDWSHKPLQDQDNWD